MINSRRAFTGVWETIRAHAIPIATSVTLSVAVCRSGILFGVIIILGIAAALAWIGGWRIEIHRHGYSQHSYQPEELDERNNEAK